MPDGTYQKVLTMKDGSKYDAVGGKVVQQAGNSSASDFATPKTTPPGGPQPNANPANQQSAAAGALTKEGAALGGSGSVKNNKVPVYNGGATSQDQAANALLGSGLGLENQPVLKNDNSSSGSNNDFFSNSFKSLVDGYAGLGKTTVTPPDYSDAINEINTTKQTTIDGITADYAQQRVQLQQKQEGETNAFKAKLIKMGVPLDSTSYSSAMVEQGNRNDIELQQLNRMEISDKSKAASDASSKLVSVYQDRADKTFQATVTNIDNLFKTMESGQSLLSMWEGRDEKEKDREQSAQEHLDTLQYQWATLDQKQQKDTFDQLMLNARDGMYDITNKSTIQTLHDMEVKAGVPAGTLVDAATGGLSKRMQNQAVQASTVERNKATTETENATRQLKVKELNAQIANIYSEISKRSKDSASTSDKKLQKDTTTEILTQLNAPNSAGKTAYGADAHISPADYLTAKKHWIDKGLNGTTFDAAFKSLRDPNNANYGVGKDTSSALDEFMQQINDATGNASDGTQ